MRLHSIVLLIASAAACYGQMSGPCGANYDQKLADLKAATTDAAVNNVVNNLITLNNSCFAQYLYERSAFKAAVRAFENSRTDKQAGGTAGGGGTSLISRGTSAKAIGIAAEYGALTQSVKGQVVTVTGNLAGVPSVLAGKDILPYCDARFGPGKNCVSSDTLRFLRRLSFAVSFDTSRDSQAVTATPTSGAPPPAGSTAASSSPVPVTFQGSGHEISQVRGRFELVNRRDVVSQKYLDAWKKAVPNAANLHAAGDALLGEINTTIGPLVDTPAYANWRQQAAKRLIEAKRTQGDLQAVWLALYSELVSALRNSSKTLDDDVARLHAAFQNFDVIEDQFVDSVSVQPLLTFEYVNNRPVAQTPVSTFRIIGEFGWGKNNLTFNGAASFYDATQPAVGGVAAGRWRDWELGGQYERKLGKLALLGPAALEASGYFQNQRIPAILDVDPKQPLPGITFVGLPDGAKKVFAEKGNIGVGQLRLVLGPGGSNVRVPLAVSWSNRTELIKKPTWRAQVGLTYDFDGLFAK